LGQKNLGKFPKLHLFCFILTVESFSQGPVQEKLTKKSSDQNALKGEINIGPSEVRAPAVGVAHAGGERSVHY
jgi:hypothetical protein